MNGSAVRQLLNHCESIHAIAETRRFVSRTERRMYAVNVLDIYLPWTTRGCKDSDKGIVVLTAGATTVFRRHPVRGAFSAMKWALGQYVAPPGVVEFKTQSDLVDGTLTVSAVEITPLTTNEKLNAHYLAWRRFLIFDCLPIWMLLAVRAIAFNVAQEPGTAWVADVWTGLRLTSFTHAVVIGIVFDVLISGAIVALGWLNTRPPGRCDAAVRDLPR